MKGIVYNLNGRVCYDFPWESKAAPQPWKQGYRRVIVPLTEQERKGSQKKVHTLIVSANKLRLIKEQPICLRPRLAAVA